MNGTRRKNSGEKYGTRERTIRRGRITSNVRRRVGLRERFAEPETGLEFCLSDTFDIVRRLLNDFSSPSPRGLWFSEVTPVFGIHFGYQRPADVTAKEEFARGRQRAAYATVRHRRASNELFFGGGGGLYDKTNSIRAAHERQQLRVR